MQNNQEIIIIAAMAENRVIGKDNALPWSIREDMAHFRELTRGSPCVMGRKTWESLPRRPLPGRLNVIVSGTLKDARASGGQAAATGGIAAGGAVPAGGQTVGTNQAGAAGTDVKIFSSLSEAIRACAAYPKIFICGGASVYREALPLANRIELTVIRKSYEGDTFFPELDPALWARTASVDFDTFSFVSYNRITKEKL